MALLLCLLLMTTLCLIGGAALSLSGLNHQIVHNGTKQVQAFYAAEAGREMALAYLREDPMWRGDAADASGTFAGGLSVGGIEAAFSVSLSDCTADENGIFNELLPAGHVLLKSTGNWIDAVQPVSCIVRISPKEGTDAAFPRAAVVSSGSVTGPLIALDDLGDADGTMVRAPVALPAANASGLQAQAEMAFSTLDNDAWDSALGGIGSFWSDPPAETRPRIFYIQGDLEISGERLLYGIVLVEGRRVTLGGESGVRGVLYAPNATDVRITNAGAAGRNAVTGQLITGPGGVAVSGNPVSVQCAPAYVDAFNVAAGSGVNMEVVPGSWTSAGMR